MTIRDPHRLGGPRGGRHTRPATAEQALAAFTWHGDDSSEPAERPGSAGSTHVSRVEHVSRPWGHEVTFAVLEGRYLGRVLHLDAGAVVPLRKRLTNDTTLYLQLGRLTVQHGFDQAQLQTAGMHPSESLFLPASMLHRITAVSASVVLEVGTAWPGWRTDEVDLEDTATR